MLKHQCSGYTRSGQQCSLSVGASYKFCHLHDPARLEQRRRTASKAGSSRPNKELKEIKATLRQLAEDVLEKRVDRRLAAVANQVYNTLLRAIAEEREVRELEEADKRIEALERLYEEEERW